MFLLFTPFSFIFLSFYFLLFFYLFTLCDFIIFWIYMEFFILVFIGVCFSLFSSRFSFLILYFLIQTLASFRILVFYISSFRILFSLALLLKLSIFPFHFWFISIAYRFSNFIFWVVSSFHKFPIFLIIIGFNVNLDSFLVWFSVVITTILVGLSMLNSSDLRLSLVLSSVGNNSWLLISSS